MTGSMTPVNGARFYDDMLAKQRRSLVEILRRRDLVMRWGRLEMVFGTLGCTSMVAVAICLVIGLENLAWGLFGFSGITEVACWWSGRQFNRGLDRLSDCIRSWSSDNRLRQIVGKE